MCSSRSLTMRFLHWDFVVVLCSPRLERKLVEPVVSAGGLANQ
jgi:hypothetical protein